jgi:predicted ATPase/DNA-binding SARP family transcriptional activator/DNA-binding CsgD family transcriptional regulator
MMSTQAAHDPSPKRRSRSDGLAPVRVRLMGGFGVWVGPRAVGEGAWHLRKAKSLVKLLSLTPRHALHREQIMDLLWPELGKTAATNNLRVSLHAARRALTPDSAAASRYLASEEERIALCPETELWVDAEAFEEAANAARRSRDPSAYRAALELYGGELLPEDLYEEWDEGRREELRRLYLSLHIELAESYEERGDLSSAVQALRKAVAEEPTYEEAHVGLMRLYALSESKEEAIRQYERLWETLSRELGIEPSASSRALKEEIVSGGFPPANRLVGSAEAHAEVPVRHNLPAQRTSFVGREREMLEVKRELAMTRLLTLTGAGGTGKTRLALEVGRDLVGAYPDGAWLVELAELSDGALVPQAVAGAVGVPERPGQPVTDTLAEYLRDKSVLLVLDNCEHLADSVAHLLDTLLDSCPRLKVLTTSREALGLAGEVLWRVPSLSVPDTDRLPAPGEMSRYEAVRLFAERARLRLPAFELTQEDAPAVAEVCRKLEGMPLAIELATARMGTLSVGQISERLEDPLSLLRLGGRTAASRQRTLRATLDWSYHLLREPEQTLFGRLSVFAGGWTLEAAEAVGTGGGIEEGEVLDLLSRLVDKSLVVTQVSGGQGVPRYRMLEPVRQYAQEKLEQSGEGEEIHRRGARFFLALAEDAELGLSGPEDAAWLSRVQAEHNNIRAVLSWALDRGDIEVGLRLAGALWQFWEARGHYGEGKRWLEEALEKDDRASATARAKALEGLSWLTYRRGDTHRAEATAKEGLELSAEARLGERLLACFKSILGQVADIRGDYAHATNLYGESLELYRQAEDKLGFARTLHDLGNVSSARREYERAKEFYEESLALSRELGGAELLGGILVSWGYMCLLEGDYERGAALNEEAAALYRGRGYKGGLDYVLDNLGWAALLQGDYERARTSYRESLMLCKELGEKMIAAESLEGLACVVGSKGEAERAARLFGAAEALREAVGYQHAPEEGALREPYLATTRSRLDERVWEAAWAEGRGMSMEQAVEYALSEEKAPASISPTPKRPSADESPALTRREEEVAALVSRGLTNHEISTKLGISERTASNHVAKILHKLGLRSRTQIASWASERQPLMPHSD